MPDGPSPGDEVPGDEVPDDVVDLGGGLRRDGADLLRDVQHRARPLAGRPAVEDALGLARDLGRSVPLPGGGRTALRWEVLATLGAVDLTLARTVEPHLDALAILAEARAEGEPTTTSEVATWGVFAAEGEGRLTATETDAGWRLSGRKPWCSLAHRLDAGLVTAWVDEERRGLFAVSLGAAGVSVDRRGWAARGLRDVPSLATEYDDVPARPVGRPDWYLARPGFAWGGIGVAAVWFGAAQRLARALQDAAGRRTPDQVALVHLGAVDVALEQARAGLARAAAEVDAGRAAGRAGALLAHRVRASVAATCEEVLTRVGHGLGPAPLVRDEEHAARVADLTVYLRQHHAERDLAALGGLLHEAAAGAPA